MAKTAAERRREKRVRAQIPLRLAYDKGEVSGSTRNFSMLGACADAGREILPGTRVGFLLEIPMYKEDTSLSGYVRGQGAIVRCDPITETQIPNRFELGIFFSYYVTPEEEKKLTRYIQYLVSEEAKEIRRWTKQYRARIEKRKKQIAEKKRKLARKKRQLARKRKALAMKRMRKKQGKPKRKTKKS